MCTCVHACQECRTSLGVICRNAVHFIWDRISHQSEAYQLDCWPLRPRDTPFSASPLLRLQVCIPWLAFDIGSGIKRNMIFVLAKEALYWTISPAPSLRILGRSPYSSQLYLGWHHCRPVCSSWWGILLLHTPPCLLSHFTLFEEAFFTVPKKLSSCDSAILLYKINMVPPAGMWGQSVEEHTPSNLPCQSGRNIHLHPYSAGKMQNSTHMQGQLGSVISCWPLSHNLAISLCLWCCVHGGVCVCGSIHVCEYGCVHVTVVCRGQRTASDIISFETVSLLFAAVYTSLVVPLASGILLSWLPFSWQEY